MFDDWKTHKPETINRSLLWEYDLDSSDWDWQKMQYIVVQRVLECGRIEDYYAMFQLYGGLAGVREIVEFMPYLGKREINWACFLFDLKENELRCCTRKQSRRELLSCS